MMRSRPSSVPRIYATSITTPAFRWLHEEAWDERQRQAFAQMRQTPAAAVFAPPPLVVRARKPTPQTIGRWLLTPALGRDHDAAGEATPAIAIAEAQLTRTQFANVTLLLSPTHSVYASWQDEGAKAALTLLISALILLVQADQVRVIPLSTKIAPTLKALGLSQNSRSLWAPLHGLALFTDGPTHVQQTSIDIDPGEWWTLPFAAADRGTLAYLEKRLAVLKKTAEQQFGGRRKRGLLQLFRRGR